MDENVVVWVNSEATISVVTQQYKRQDFSKALIRVMLSARVFSEMPCASFEPANLALLCSVVMYLGLRG